jgi:FkbM family methyltransferase
VAAGDAWVPGRWLAGRVLNRLERALPGWFPTERRSYSHQGEDRVLMDLLDGHAPRTYVDVGAHHPVESSDTYLLYRCGWSGLAIEGDARWRRAWRRRRPRDRFVAAVVDVVAGRRQFFLQGETSTLRGDWAGSQAEAIEVDCVTLGEVLERHLPPGGFGLLKIDVEGSDLEILAGLDTRRWRPCAVLVETHHWTTADAVADPRLRSWCRDAGYTVVAHNRRNLLLAEDGWLRRRREPVAEAYRILNPTLYG